MKMEECEDLKDAKKLQETQMKNKHKTARDFLNEAKGLPNDPKYDNRKRKLLTIAQRLAEEAVEHEDKAQEIKQAAKEKACPT